MNPNNRRALKDAARSCLETASFSPKKLILIHTGAAVALSLLISLLDYLLGLKIDQLTGLGSYNTRAVLGTISTFLNQISLIVIPFWEAGLIFTVLSITRKQEVAPASLLEGFRRFGPFLRLFLLNLGLYIAAAFLSMIVSFQVFLYTPLSNSMTDVLSTLPSSSVLLGGTQMVDDATQAALLDAYVPLIVVFAVLFFVLIAVVSYFFRMSRYILFDRSRAGAFAAMRDSYLQMQGHKKQLFFLDLSFWWYYLLQILTVCLAYVPTFFGFLQMALPEVSFPLQAISYLFMFLTLAGQFLLYVLARNRVEATYAQFYLATAPRQAG